MSINATLPQEMMFTLRARYLESVMEKRSLLADVLQNQQSRALTPEDYEGLASLAHKLSGSGATYGFPEISESATRLERLIVDEPQATEAEIILEVQKLVVACTAAYAPDADGPFHVPPDDQATDDHGDSVAKSGDPLPNRLNVLIVDDDPSARAILAALVTDVADVIVASSGSEAMDIMLCDTPDLVLLDHNMPGAISGLMVLEQMKKLDALSHIPVVMVTAARQPNSIMRGLKAGAVDYVIKPYNVKEVATKIQTRLKRLMMTIMIVDDDRSICDLLERRFIAAGYRAQVAYDGSDAMLMMAEKSPDLVLLDRMLPGLDGSIVLQKMRATPHLKDTPVVFLTARRRETDILEGFELGVADYIVKPFNPDELIARCARLI